MGFCNEFFCDNWVQKVVVRRDFNCSVQRQFFFKIVNLYFQKFVLCVICSFFVVFFFVKVFFELSNLDGDGNCDSMLIIVIYNCLFLYILNLIFGLLVSLMNKLKLVIFFGNLTVV